MIDIIYVQFYDVCISLFNKFIIRMSLEIIIQEIKVLGYILPAEDEKRPFTGQQITQKRRFRISFGDNTFVAQEFGYFKSRTQLAFYEPYSFFYDNQSKILNIQIFKQHQYLDNTDISKQLNAEVDLSDFTIIKGDYIEAQLTDLYGQSIGKLILLVDVFKKGPKFYEKVVSSVLVEKVKEEAERVEKQKISQASKNIKNLMVNNQLGGTLMTINSMHVIPSKEDTEIFNKDCLIVIKYGAAIKVYTKVLKSTNKESVSFLDYLEFLKNQVKFEFYFLYFDEVGTITCKAKGQIKYIVFDQTINSHSIMLFDKRSMKYGALMVKFIEKQAQNINLQYKVDKKLRQKEEQITEAVDEFNRYKFDAKYQNHVLSQKMMELQLQRMEEEEKNNRPLNPEQKKQQEQHKKFIDFMQKQVVRIEKELQKREQTNKKNERKERYLPSMKNKSPDTKNNTKNLNTSQSVNQFRQKKVKFPKV